MKRTGEDSRQKQGSKLDWNFPILKLTLNPNATAAGLQLRWRAGRSRSRRSWTRPAAAAAVSRARMRSCSTTRMASPWRSRWTLLQTEACRCAGCMASTTVGKVWLKDLTQLLGTSKHRPMADLINC